MLRRGPAIKATSTLNVASKAEELLGGGGVGTGGGRGRRVGWAGGGQVFGVKELLEAETRGATSRDARNADVQVRSSDMLLVVSSRLGVVSVGCCC